MTIARRFLRLSASAAIALAVTPALAAETGSPPELPPPPPPPLSQPQGGPAEGGGGGAAPAHGSAPALSSAPARAQKAPPAVTESRSGDGGDGDSALDTRWQVAGMLGLSTDYLNFGLGVRGGKTLDSHIYIGGSLVYHFASGAGYYASGPYGAYGTSGSAVYLGPEGGYDFDLHVVVLRAYLGLGAAFFNYSVNTPSGTLSSSSAQFVVWPGASVIWSPPDTPFFVGGDLRLVSVPDGPAVGFFAMGGIHFGS